MSDASTELPHPSSTEPWLRGTLTEVPSVARAVLHALELAQEDIALYCLPLTDAEINASVSGLPSVAFHLRHIARSVDRLLTYAEGKPLNARQLADLQSELEADAASSTSDLLAEVAAALASGTDRIRLIHPASLDEARAVGRKGLPTTVAGLLIHVADHTQRHVGQVIATAKVIAAQHIHST